MPTIYRIEDSGESAPTKMDGSLAGAFIVDGRKTGKIMPDEYLALLMGGVIEPLPHPMERNKLQAHGQTYLSASLRGILLRVERRLCLRCGSIFDSPRLVFSGAAGCLPALFVSLSAFILLRMVRGTPTGISVLAAFTLLMAVLLFFQFAGALYVRVRFAKRQAAIAQAQCSACDGRNSVSIREAAGKRIPIGTEGKWIQVSIAGKA